MKASCLIVSLGSSMLMAEMLTFPLHIKVKGKRHRQFSSNISYARTFKEMVQCTGFGRLQKNAVIH